MLDFYRGKKVLVTGHTGFKGTWLCRILISAGAEVTGYSLEAPTEPNLFALAEISDRMNSVIGDIRNLNGLKKVFSETKPEIVFHLAAQPIVRESYLNPVYTYETNVMGTVNVCECVRLTPSVKSFVNVTTDKVYRNLEREEGYREDEMLDGYDPYSNSKSCSELVTHSYVNSFFRQAGIAVSTARAGNVIGGGDFAKDRIIPDCIRAVEKGDDIIVRNPFSTRPYQHVLEPLSAYLLIAQRQYKDRAYAGYYNVGPLDVDCVTTGELVDIFCAKWNAGDEQKKAKWINVCEKDAPHEATFLKLDCTKMRDTFGWIPKWRIARAIEETVNWTWAYLEGKSIPRVMDQQIKAYFSE